MWLAPVRKCCSMVPTRTRCRRSLNAEIKDGLASCRRPQAQRLRSCVYSRIPEVGTSLTTQTEEGARLRTTPASPALRILMYSRTPAVGTEVSSSRQTKDRLVSTPKSSAAAVDIFLVFRLHPHPRSQLNLWDSVDPRPGKLCSWQNCAQRRRRILHNITWDFVDS